MFPSELLSLLQQQIDPDVSGARLLSDGLVTQTALLQGAGSRQIFLKYGRTPEAGDLLHKEMLGLSLIGASRVIRVPKILGRGSAGPWYFLALEFIVPGYKNRQFWIKFGEALAALHQGTALLYGFAHDNYIGALPQSNTRRETWAEFYTEERLLPQLKQARDARLLDESDAWQLERLCRRLDQICPEEGPALIHGDLWSGNFLCSLMGEPVLIDPAACYAHREMDLAMSRLFGGFDPVFYEAYEAASPLEPGFEQRVGVYQLYYLLVHINLFGQSYVGQLRELLGKYG